MNDFYLFSSMLDQPAIADLAWLEEHARKYQHFRCQHWQFDSPADRVVLRDRGSDVPFGFVDGILYRYLRKDLLDVLSPEALKHLELGSLIDRDGSEIAELRTVWSHKRILLRGGPDSTRWICSCKQLIYYPMGAWYIMRDDVGDTPIYLTSLGDLLLSAGLYSRVRTQRWKKVAISKIRILTEPRDGLPAKLDTLTQEDIGRSFETAPPR